MTLKIINRISQAPPVGAVEPRGPTVFLRLRTQPDDRECDDAEEHRDGEEVPARNREHPPTDDRDVELGVERSRRRPREVNRRQDEEAPHGEEVRDTGTDHPTMGLVEHLADLVADPLTEVVLYPLIGGRLTRN